MVQPSYGSWNTPHTNWPGSTNFPSKGQPDWDEEKIWQPDPQHFKSPTGGVGPDPWFMSQGFIESPSATYIEGFRGLLGTSRGTQESAMQKLEQYASGRKSAAREAIKGAIDRAEMRNRAAARAARSPAEARAALYAMAGAQQQAARGGATAAMQEQLGAQKAYLAGAGQMRQADIAQYEAGQKERLRQIHGDALIKEIGARYLALGLSDKEAERRARIDFEKMKLAGYEGAKGRQSAMDLLKQQQSSNLLNALIGGGFSAAGGLLSAAAFSDERGKKNIYAPSCAGAKDIYGQADNFLDEMEELDPYTESMDLDLKPAKHSGPMVNAGWPTVDEPGMAAPAVDEPGMTPEATKARVEAQGPTTEQRQGQMVASGLMSAGKQIAGANQQQDMLGLKIQQAASQKNQADIMRMLDSMGGQDQYVTSDLNEKNIVEFLDNMRAVNFEYKDPAEHGYGERTGVIAQDMEKSKLGAANVVEDEEGMKHIDISPQKFNPLVLASLANLNKRINALEGE
jgi:hypothetical protein